MVIGSPLLNIRYTPKKDTIECHSPTVPQKNQNLIMPNVYKNLTITMTDSVRVLILMLK